MIIISGLLFVSVVQKGHQELLKKWLLIHGINEKEKNIVMSVRAEYRVLIKCEECTAMDVRRIKRLFKKKDGWVCELDERKVIDRVWPSRGESGFSAHGYSDCKHHEGYKTHPITEYNHLIYIRNPGHP